MLFVDYTFDLVGEHIMMDRELKPDLVKIKHGDRFMASIAKVERDGVVHEQVTFVKHPDDIRTTTDTDQNK
jgi:hypothetical protein